ncbi:DNA-dependent ATPase fun30 [Saitoella coloradoensis]
MSTEEQAAKRRRIEDDYDSLTEPNSSPEVPRGNRAKASHIVSDSPEVESPERAHKPPNRSHNSSIQIIESSPINPGYAAAKRRAANGEKDRDDTMVIESDDEPVDLIQKSVLKPASGSVRRNIVFPSTVIGQPTFKRATGSNPPATSAPSPDMSKFGASLQQFRHDPNKKVERLDSLTSSSSVRPSNAMEDAYMSSKPRRLMQQKPEPPKQAPWQPNIMDLNYQTNLLDLQAIYPDIKLDIVRQALIDARGNKDDAALKLGEGTYDKPVMISDSPAPRPTMMQKPLPASSAKREIKKPSISIAQRWGHTIKPPATVSPVPGRPSVSINLSSPLATLGRPAYEAPKPRKKLVQRPAAVIRADSDDEAPASSGDSEASDSGDDIDSAFARRVLDFLNTCTIAQLKDVASCNDEAAQAIIDQRPHKSLGAVRDVKIAAPPAAPKSRGRGPRPVGDKIVDTCLEVMQGYEAVDALIKRCDVLGDQVSDAIKAWGIEVKKEGGELEVMAIETDEAEVIEDIPEVVEVDGEKVTLQPVKRAKTGYMLEQPRSMAEDVKLKDYQLTGLNWLTLLYEKKLSGILADEMGLGKTCQVISFLTHLFDSGKRGKHLIVVPGSTLENWLREFQRFSPDMVVEPYYGTQKEREEMRVGLEGRDDWHVLVTTYNIATGAKPDRSFLRQFKFDVCVYDEGHMLKNSMSNRYTHLMALKAKFRLLLTGTPLQNNLQELISLLSFMLPSLFEENKEALQSVFKIKPAAGGDDAAANLLSKERITRARTMMTPFILRRKKQQVLDMPDKFHKVEYCELADGVQKEIYAELDAASKAAALAKATNAKLPRAQKKAGDVTNHFMNLRKAANHPMLFRRRYNDKTLRKMANQIMNEDVYKDNNEEYIYEDMTYMSDFELHNLCGKFRTIRRFQLDEQTWMEAGKVEKLKDMLPTMKANGDRILLFSQFTSMLDILEKILTTLNITFMRLDGQTKVEERQAMIDEFHEDEDVTVFLLSTQAGGFGINLACANVVILYDCSYNPHNDKQAEDRAHRFGQKRDVRVVRLITKGTIEEKIHALANTKLALDESVSAGAGGEDDAAAEEAGASLVAKMMMEDYGLKEATPDSVVMASVTASVTASAAASKASSVAP